MLADNLNYAVAMILFALGFYTLVMPRNIIKKIIGFNIMETAVFLLLVSIGYLEEGVAPIVTQAAEPPKMVNPIPQALILTGIVIAVSTTALALSLAIRLYRHYGTLKADEFIEVEQ